MALLSRVRESAPYQRGKERDSIKGWKNSNTMGRTQKKRKAEEKKKEKGGIA